MKRTVLFILSVILTMLLMAATAKAGSLTSYGGDSNYNWYASTAKYAGSYTLYGSMNTRLAAIDYVQTSYYISSPTTVTIYLGIGGTIGTDPTDTMRGSLGMSTVVNGVAIGQNTFSDYYDVNDNGKSIVALSSPRKPELWSSGSGSFWFTSEDVKYVGGYANYSTYSDEKGSNTYFNFNPSWTLTFTNSKAAADFSAGLAATGAANVPEPASLGVLTLGALALLACGRRI